jgi:parallel beta-helix repeat protein
VDNLKKNIGLVLLVLILITITALCVVFPQTVKADSPTEYIRISIDGSVIGTDQIQRNGNTYTLTGNISGGIQVQKSYILIDGAGYAIKGNNQYERGIDLSNGRGQDPSRTQINNVTAKNLKIINCYYAIGNENTDNNTFIGNYIANCDTAFRIIGSSNNTLIHNTVKDCVTGISINYAGFNIITENNIINNSLLVWLSTEPFVDRNYWSNYQTKYPNAKEIEKSGLPNLFWDTPYNYGESLGNYTDSHPLINPISTSPISTPTPTSTPIASPTQSPLPSPSPTFSPSPSPSIPEFPAWIVVPLVLVSALLAVFWRRRNRR